MHLTVARYFANQLDRLLSGAMLAEATDDHLKHWSGPAALNGDGALGASERVYVVVDMSRQGDAVAITFVNRQVRASETALRLRRLTIEDEHQDTCVHHYYAFVIDPDGDVYAFAVRHEDGNWADVPGAGDNVLMVDAADVPEEIVDELTAPTIGDLSTYNSAAVQINADHYRHIDADDQTGEVRYGTLTLTIDEYNDQTLETAERPSDLIISVRVSYPLEPRGDTLFLIGDQVYLAAPRGIHWLPSDPFTVYRTKRTDAYAKRLATLRADYFMKYKQESVTATPAQTRMYVPGKIQTKYEVGGHRSAHALIDDLEAGVEVASATLAYQDDYGDSDDEEDGGGWLPGRWIVNVNIHDELTAYSDYYAFTKDEADDFATAVAIFIDEATAKVRAVDVNADPIEVWVVDRDDSIVDHDDGIYDDLVAAMDRRFKRTGNCWSQDQHVKSLS